MRTVKNRLPHWSNLSIAQGSLRVIITSSNSNKEQYSYLCGHKVNHPVYENISNVYRKLKAKFQFKKKDKILNRNSDHQKIISKRTLLSNYIDELRSLLVTTKTLFYTGSLSMNNYSIIYYFGCCVKAVFFVSTHPMKSKVWTRNQPYFFSSYCTVYSN